MTRSKLAVAILGLAVAVTAIGDASARSAIKTVVIKSASAHKVPLVHVGTSVITHPVIAHSRIIRHVRVLHRAPRLVTVVSAGRRVRLVKRPLLQKQAMAHRTIVKKTIIR